MCTSTRVYICIFYKIYYNNKIIDKKIKQSTYTTILHLLFYLQHIFVMYTHYSCFQIH